MAKELRVNHGPVDEDIVDNLTDEEKAWLRSWNRGDEIPGEDADATNAEDDDDSDEDGSEYDDWTNDQLRDELERRELPKSGNHDALVARLVEDDNSDEE